MLKKFAMYHLIEEKSLLSVVVRVVTFSVNKSLDFHDTTFSVTTSLFKAKKRL